VAEGRVLLLLIGGNRKQCGEWDVIGCNRVECRSFCLSYSTRGRQARGRVEVARKGSTKREHEKGGRERCPYEL